ncbi:ABC transporter permease [Iocasia frigidifontis]|uniref:ABC transporter permease n=1 Tax=Iocasia fonsfrigidae TaxID=2682810 RepID=A0A8A7KIM9_9FIRM|nr:ABC transporter permease [Iocasia fonsfrigidae]QTL97732.1 ABC transporter permease [Iocasia fonsfrigidae]
MFENILSADKKLLLRKYGLLLGMIILIMVLSLVSDAFLNFRNIINISRQVSINGIIAIGMTFVILTGGIDLSVGSLVAVSGVIGGSIISQHPDMVWPAILASVFVCSIFGLINGIAVTKFNIAPFIITLSTMTISRGFALVYSNGRPYIFDSDSFSVIGNEYIGFVPLPVIILIVIFILAMVLLRFTRFGRYVYAIGGNKEAARASGINVNNVVTKVYVLIGALSGLAGIVLASRINSGQPAIGSGYELDAIASVVIGGTSLNGGIGKITGTVLGFLLIGIINNGLNLLNVSSYWQQIVKGIIIASAVLFDQYTKKTNS